MAEKKGLSFVELKEIYNKNAAELDAVYDRHHVIGMDLCTDKKTNRPCFTVILETHGRRNDKKVDISDIPTVVGPDKIPVKVAFQRIPKAL